MPRVYQRVALASLLVSCLLQFACGPATPASVGRGQAAPGGRSPRRAVAIETLLDARSYELVALDAVPARLIANELSGYGSRAIAVPAAGGKLVALAAAEASESRVLASLSREQLLIEEIVGGVPRLILSGPAKRHLVLAPLVSGRERLLVVAPDRRRFWSAARAAEGATERLIETQLPSGSRRGLESIAAPFTIAALSPDGNLLALRRTIHDEADEVVLSDRRTGEMRLLLPDRDEGRFRPLEFLGTDRFLLLIADDGSDRPRLELLEIASGHRRPVFEPGPDCSVVDGRRASGAELRVDLSCRGRRESRRLELSGRARELPALPAPLRLTAFLLQPGGDALALAGSGVVATDLWSWSPADGLRPLSYGAAPALDPDRLGASESVTLGAHQLPGELWLGATPPRAGALWLDDGTTAPKWGELDPALAALVDRGWALLRVRARGGEGFGRRFRRAADGDPSAAILADLDDAAAALAARLPERTPLVVVGEGGWAGAAVLTALADIPGGVHGAERFAAGAALFPDPDPLGLLNHLLETPEPARSWLVGLWGDPSNPKLAERRAAWRFPVDRVSRPALIVLDPSLATVASLPGAIDAARAAGRPVESALEPRSHLTDRLSRASALRLIGFLEHQLAGAPPREAERR